MQQRKYSSLCVPNVDFNTGWNCFGVPGGTRTPDLLLRRQLLYPVELRALEGKAGNNGRGGGIRTHDPLLPKQMRYQAALRPDTETIL